MYHERLTYDLNKTPLENTIALFNSKLKAGMLPIVPSETKLSNVEHIDQLNITNLTLEEWVDGVNTDNLRIRVLIPDIQVLINELDDFMDLAVGNFNTTHKNIYIESLIDASKMQGWDLSKQINIIDVSLGNNSLGEAMLLLTQDNPFYKPNYTLKLRGPVDTGVEVDVIVAETKVSESL